MIEAGLVSSLVANLNINFIITCVVSGSDDAVNGMQLERPVLQQVIRASEITSAIGDAEDRSCLIICPSANFSQLSSEPRAFAKNVYWLFNDDEKLVKSDLFTLPLTFLSNVLVTTELLDRDLVLYEYYAIKSVRKKAYFGLWNQSGGLVVDRYLLERRKDLADVKIVVTVKELSKLLIIKSKNEMSGWFGDVVAYMQNKLNFR